MYTSTDEITLLSSFSASMICVPSDYVDGRKQTDVCPCGPLPFDCRALGGRLKEKSKN